MRVVPVLDLMGGVVVHGRGGRRGEYRPIQSRLVPDALPETAGRAFFELGLAQLYLADLDAIGGAEPAWSTYDRLAALGVRLWIDAGTGSRTRAESMLRLAERTPAVTGIVVGLESVSDAESLGQILEVLGPQRAIFSLDLGGGQPLAGAGWAR